MSDITNQEIKSIIDRILVLSGDLLKSLRTEKKQTGDYSKQTTFHESSYEYVFSVSYFLTSSEERLYPAVGKKMRFDVKVFRNGLELLKCHVCQFSYTGTLDKCCRNDKFEIGDVYLSDTSNVEKLLHVGDIITVVNKKENRQGDAKKVAYAKVEEFDLEKDRSRTFMKRIKLSKVLGHPETLAFEEGWPAQVNTYIADESTEEYFEGKDVKEIFCNMEIFTAMEPVHFDGYTWYYYTKEKFPDYIDYPLTLAPPFTEKELTSLLKKRALNELLEKCRGEFCYKDPRVEKYKENYMILGEETINAIYHEYMTWLKENCTTYIEECSWNDFTGVAIDWHGKENEQPVFDLSC